jgi:hypothetical protein
VHQLEHAPLTLVVPIPWFSIRQDQEVDHETASCTLCASVDRSPGD